MPATLRAPPTSILQARFRTSRMALLALPEGPLEAVDLVNGNAVTLERSGGCWTPCDRLPDPDLVGLPPLGARVPAVRDLPIALPRRVVALGGLLAIALVAALVARGIVTHGGSAAGALERRALPSAEASGRLPRVAPNRIRIAIPALARGGAAAAVAVAPVPAVPPPLPERRRPETAPAAVAPSRVPHVAPPALPAPPRALAGAPLRD